MSPSPFDAPIYEKWSKFLFNASILGSSENNRIRTLEVEFGTLEVLFPSMAIWKPGFSKWISGNPVFPNGHLEVRLSRIDIWS
jgi:hypothetical protein